MKSSEEVSIVISGRIISKKNSKQLRKSWKTGKMFVASSDAYTRYADSALVQIRKQKMDGTAGRVDPPYQVNYVFYVKGKLDIDVDNAISSMNDILQLAGIITNDSEIISGSFDKIREAEEWSSCVIIKNIV